LFSKLTTSCSINDGLCINATEFSPEGASVKVRLLCSIDRRSGFAAYGETNE